MVSTGRSLHSRTRLHRSLGHHRARAHAAAAPRVGDGVAADVGESARGARRQARADDALDREGRRPRAPHPPRLHHRTKQHRDRGELRRRLRGGAVDHGGIRARGGRRDGRFALLQRCLEQRDVRGRRGAKSAQESSARAGVGDGAREPSLHSRQRVVPDGAPHARHRGWRDRARTRNRVRDAGSRGHWWRWK